jgi:hypothetical protein
METLSNSFNQIALQVGAFWNVFGYVWFIILPPLLYFLFKILWLYHIQLSYLFSLDWVLLEIIPPKDIEKSPKLMEAFFAGLQGAEKSFSVEEEYMQGVFADQFSLELISNGGEVHFLIRCQKKQRHMVEAHLYAQYPDIIVREFPEYVFDVPKVIPNSQWDVWGTDFEFTKANPYPIRTYPQFEESITGKMIDPLAGLVEVMGKLAPGQWIWHQMIIAPCSPSWGGKEGKKVIDKLAGREAAVEGVLSRVLKDIMDVFSNLLAAMRGPVEFAKTEKKEQQPLEFRLTPGERDTLKAVESNLGKLFYKTKMRFVLVGRKESFDKNFSGAFIGGIKQFNDDNLNSIKPNNISKTSTQYWFKKSRLKYKQRKIFRRYRNRSTDGATMVFSTEELATLFHLPDMSVLAPSITRVEAKRGGAPANLPIE